MSLTNRSGLTLLELTVAIVIGVGLLVSGRLLLEQVSETKQSLLTQELSDRRLLLHERTLQELFRNLEITSHNSASFQGDEQSMQFMSWCDSASGLRGKCRVRLHVDTAVVVSTTQHPIPVTLMHDSIAGVFRYLADVKSGGHWFRIWGHGAMIPLAIGIVFGRDTTILRIGARG